MNELLSRGSVPVLAMTTVEIAELTGRAHRNVVRDARAMLVQLHGEGGVLSFEHTQANPQNGQHYTELRLPKRETLILVSGYSVPMRARIIDRWQELEAAAAPASPAIPQTFAEALRLAADNLERAEAAERQVAKMEPKVAALDRFANHTGSFRVRDAGAMLGIGQKALVGWLLEHRWMYRQVPGGPLSVMAEKEAAGYVTAKAVKAGVSLDGADRAGVQARITTKGLERIATRLAEDRRLPAPVLVPSARMTGRSPQ